MAKYQMEYSCGHTETVQLYGKNSERERVLEWTKDHKLCPACYKTKMDAERQQENERAANLAGMIGFSALSGSEKQISWATSIRMKVYEAMIAMAADPKMMAKCLSLETSAKWWIDNREQSALTISRMIFGIYKDSAIAIEDEFKASKASKA